MSKNKKDQDNLNNSIPEEADINKAANAPSDNTPDAEKDEKRKKKKIFWLVLAIFFLAVAVTASIILWNYTHGDPPNMDEYKLTEADDTTSAPDSVTYIPVTDDTTPVTEPVDTAPGYADFAQLQAQNPDVYAWIIVPGTKIDYPIVQHELEASYYLRRDWLGNPDVCGCIFTQFYNSKDFTDRNTLIYGHFMWNKTFFGGLHDFRDANFFNEHDEIIIYTVDRKLTYRIFAAYEYDSRHILNSFNFHDDEVYAEYLESCLNPTTVARNVREGVELTIDDRIVTLSTCVQSGAADKRYLVQGVLINEQPTD